MINSVGRCVPEKPYLGIGAYSPEGRQASPPIRTCRDYPPSGDKRTPDLRTALKNAGLRDGMVISTHHHLRNGDFLAAQIFAAADSLGVRDLVWFPSAVFPCHVELIPYLERGVIHHIEGSLNGPVGDFASRGGMHGLAILRSHGARYRSIQDGDIRVDIAVIGAPTSDSFGNMKGTTGPSACGGLGFAMADAQFADHVIAVTDNLVPYPCAPWQIQGNYVDQVVQVDRIGDSSKILSGTTELTRSPERLLIAENAAKFVAAAGVLKEGWSFQAGAGGISLAFTLFVRDLMRERGVRARFVRGGSTRYLVEMLETGLTDYILDGQTFDLEGIRSMRENANHLMTTPFNSYNYHGKGNVASMLDCAVLGATEVDLDFNANVVTHSDGRMLHGIGGWQDALFSRCTILAVPTFRNRVPIVRDRLTTFCGPGELVDVIVTERGIAVNPRRTDLLTAVAGSNLPIRPLQDIKDEAEALCGGPPEPLELDGPIVGHVTWVDGTLLDVVYKVQL